MVISRSPNLVTVVVSTSPGDNPVQLGDSVCLRRERPLRIAIKPSIGLGLALLGLIPTFPIAGGGEHRRAAIATSGDGLVTLKESGFEITVSFFGLVDRQRSAPRVAGSKMIAHGNLAIDDLVTDFVQTA